MRPGQGTTALRQEQIATMTPLDRILTKQGMQQAKAWLDAVDGRLEALRSALERSDLNELRLTLELMESSAYLDRLRTAAKDSAWIELLEKIAAMPPTPAAYYERCSSELQYRAIEIDDKLLRSCQPRLQDLRLLKANGLKQVANLRDESGQSEEFCKELNLGYLYLPVPDRSVPDRESVERFLQFCENGRTLVHCLAGRGRTGIFVACYRVRQGMQADEAIGLTESEVQPMRPHQREWIRDFAKS